MKIDTLNRRKFLVNSAKCTALLISGLSGLLTPFSAWASRNISAFSAETERDALAELFPDREIIETDEIEIGVHELVENGAVVPVNVETSLPDIRSISILADKNPNPLIARFNLTPRCRGFVATRLKIAEPSNVVVVVESGQKLFSARKFIEVVAGGCG